MAPTLPLVRPILRVLSRAASAKPIETVVITFCLTTYAYFVCLQAVKHSSFLSPSSPYSDLKPAYVIPPKDGAGEWTAVEEDMWSSSATDAWSKVELQQLVVALDSNHRAFGRSSPLPTSFYDLTTPFIHSALSNFTGYLTSTGSSSGYTYPALCYPSPTDPASCLSSLDLPTSQTRSTTFTLAFRPPPTNRERWASDMSGRIFTSGDVKFVIGRREDRIDQMRSATWVGYALRSFLWRFWDLARNADSMDIFVVLIGYLLMHATFVNLFIKGRQLGSHVWLATTTLTSSVFAFVLSVPLSLLVGIPFDPVALSEALPFLVITVAFDKPLRLAQSVFSHPALYAHSQVSSLKGNTAKAGGRMTFKPASEIIQDAVESVGEGIVRDYAVEVALLSMGSLAGVAGLKEFCALAALILIADCVMLFTFYVALLHIFVEVRRVKLIRRTMKRRATGEADVPSTPSISERPSPISAPKVSAEGEVVDPEKNPTLRLKLILIAAFLTLHILNIFTTLTPAVALNRFIAYPTKAAASTSSTVVDIKALTLSPILDTLAAISTVSQPIIVRLASPVYVRVIPQAIGHSKSAGGLPHTPEVAMIEAFMSEWSNVVGDPILSKWIVVALALSVFLNGYLLKGIGASTTPIQQAVAFAPDSTAPSQNPSPKKKSGIFRVIGAGREQSREKDSKSDNELTPAEEYHLQMIKQTKERKFLGTIDTAVSRLKRSDSSVSVMSSGVGTPLNLGAATPYMTESPVMSRSNSLLFSSQSLGLSTGLEAPKREATPAPVEEPVPSEPVEVKPSPSTHLIAPVPAVKEKAVFGIPTPIGTPRGTTESIGRRSYEECLKAFEDEGVGALNDEEIILLSQKGKIAPYALEKILGDFTRAVKIRRALISRSSATKTLENSLVPMNDYDYTKVFGACCENVIGFMPLPLGVAGPLNIDGESVIIPMATAEGTLVASTSRGCKALNAGGGVTTVLTQDAMTRGPCIEFPSIVDAAKAKLWIDSPEGSKILRDAFDSTSRFARLQGLKCALAGRTLYVRFASSTGDAMGMNMISKGTEKALGVMSEHFPTMSVLALSGNYCTDKKPNAMNWIEGRGKSVVAEAVVPGSVVKSVLKTTVRDLVFLNGKKNLQGSAMAGSIGGFNAHAANILTAMFLATGQDPAQNVVSSNCMTHMEAVNQDQDLLITVSMPSIEVGTVGGGTVLPPQGAVLDMLGLRGAHQTSPGHNARRLARVIAAAVMAGELSLMSALAAGHLIKAHMAHNRSQPTTPLPTRPSTPAAFAKLDVIAAAEQAVEAEREKRKDEEKAADASTKPTEGSG